ncbi:MAG TPA: hypothetical protein VE775_00610, partial [Pyrinomonadaceae bacterium]|nr:hypothetical protein [Pyrinomonadaceae bacterium]
MFAPLGPFRLNVRTKLLLGLLLLAPAVQAQKLKGVDANEDAVPVVQAQQSSQTQTERAVRPLKPGGASAKLGRLGSTAAPAASYTNSTPITITDCPGTCSASQPASLYPSPITVVGEVGVVQRVSVTINGLAHSFPSDIDMLLVSPTGRKSVIMSDFGAGAPGVNGINMTLDDYAATPIPSTVTGNTGFPFVT